MQCLWKTPLTAVLVLGLASVVRAQTDLAATNTPVALSGTLAKVRETGTVAIGYRVSSVPFSYLSARGEPIGYSIALCRALVASMEEAVHKSLEIQWTPVTAESRIDAVANGQIDLECGSTTNNLERQQRVGFSPTIFVSGTKLLVKKGSPIKDFRDLSGKTVAVTHGTTNEKTMRALSERFKLNLHLLVQDDHAESFLQVSNGRAEAFATDDVLLYGLIAQNKGKVPGSYQVVSEFLSYDPYGIMYRKGDAQLARVVNDTFRALASDGEISRQYQRWFLQKLPQSNTSIDLPMSPQLETILEALAVPAE